ncbi:uncharacterized protein UTRI_03173_B [Ustilago trichophora]|uniref:Uncharacterized protein n=1 Tax=Ustilago trichophora TaxID=86804 RepID=A0A5C3E5R0_9BASI|nr:uncharacterized protein UTRI_03173_B [Ustilago trichophora]
MSALSSSEAGPSRLSTAATVTLQPGRHDVCTYRPVFSPPTIDVAFEDDDNDEPSRVGSSDCSIDTGSETAYLFGAGIVACATLHRSFLLSLRPMASEMVRPPELSSPALEWCSPALVL